MTPITINQVCELHNLNESELADYLDVSVSLISKIKWNTTYITTKTQEKFQKKFPDYILVNYFSNPRKPILELQLEIERYKNILEGSVIITEKEYKLFKTLIEEKIKENKKLIEHPLVSLKAKEQLTKENEEMEEILNERQN